MGLLFVVATMLLVVVGSSYGDEPPQDLSFIKAMIEPYVSCTIGKLSCSHDCKSIEICLGDTLEVVKACKGETPMCDRPTVTCMKEEEAECGEINPSEFTCRGPVGGRFPNPNDCHSYFECQEPVPPPDATTTAEPPPDKIRTAEPPPEEITTAEPPPDKRPQHLNLSPRSSPGALQKCNPEKNAYDPLSTTCRFKDTHRVCKEGPVPACKTELQAGPLPENPNIYYVCVRVNGALEPWLAKCADPTTVFQDGKCVDSDEVTTSVDPSVTTTAAGQTTTSQTGETTTQSGQTTTQTGEATTTQPGQTTTQSGQTTTQPGQTTTQPGQTTTQSGQTTTQPGQTTTQSGQTTTQPGEATTTQPGETTTSQTAATTTTTSAPTTTSTAATTTSTAATTTSTAATTTSTAATTTSTAATTTLTAATTTTTAAPTTSTIPPPLTTAYYCLEPDTTVPDPLDCRSYYLCTTDMVQIHFRCQEGYHYDHPTQRCKKGSCTRSYFFDW